ncbi:mechanosensitive ion channel family protein [Sulfolobus tengchongensis]|uniref:Mechanosensitive ion channel family protein n=1 Tax=Sulfolobus tengchongensis TaxID=207809 RepID=A0AAX4KY15_9CREN
MEFPLIYLEAIIIIVISVIIAKFLSTIIRRRLHGELPVHVIRNLTNGVYYIIIAIGVGVAIGISGINITSILVAGGVVGIILGLALQSTLSNFFAGILIITERPFKIGDFINYQNTIGVVVDIGLLSTKLYSWEGYYVRVPNSILFTSLLINYSNSRARLVRVQFTVFQEIDVQKVINAIKVKLDQQPYVLVEPQSVVFVLGFTENGITLEARAWAPQSLWFDLYSNMPKIIDDTLKELGITYAYKKVIVENDNMADKLMADNSNKL